MAIMTPLSLAIFFILSFLLIRSSKNNLVVIAGLKVKVMAGIGLGVIYTFYYQEGDTLKFFAESATLANVVIEHPENIFKIYINTTQIPELSQKLLFTGEPRALFFSKFASFFYLLTGGNYWTMGAYFSLISFVGVYLLVEEINRNFKNVRVAAYIAFYFLPTFVFWTSGLLKEGVAVFAISLSISLVLRFNRTNQYSSWVHWILLFLSLWLLWKLKYYYAAVLIPILASLIIYHLTRRSKKYGLVIGFATLIIGLIVISQMHYNLKAAHLLHVVYENYQNFADDKADLNISYSNFDGSIYGFVINIPLALFTGLFRPMIGESGNILQLLVALENLALLIVLVLAMIKSRMRCSFKNPYLVMTIGYVVFLAIFLAFAIPNFGSLSRYKVAYWPFFVLIVIVWFVHKEKRLESS